MEISNEKHDENRNFFEREVDYLFHLNLDTKSHNLKEMFGDVKVKFKINVRLTENYISLNSLSAWAPVRIRCTNSLSICKNFSALSYLWVQKLKIYQMAECLLYTKSDLSF